MARRDDEAGGRALTTLEHALAYIRRGWSVIPLKPGTKTPAVELAPFLSGERRYTAETAEFVWGGSGAFEGQPSGIGIICGKPSNLVVVDIDPRNGGDTERIIRECPTNYGVATGGGGVHLYCLRPDLPHVPKGKTKYPGVDRQADGSYVVAPPTLHPSGDPYSIIRDGELWHLPYWVLEKPEPKAPEGEPSQPWAVEMLGHPERCLPGTQEETLTRLCWYAAKHINHRDAAELILWNWLRQVPQNPQDPWTPQHVADRLDRALEKRALEPGHAGPLVNGSVRPAPTDALRAKIRTARSFTEQAAADAERIGWLVQDFIAAGCWTEIIGVMKEGKSTLVCGMLRALLDGASFLGRPSRQSRVLYMAEQVGISFKATLERGRLTDRDDLDVLTIADTFGIPWDEAAPAAVELAKERGCQIIVVDTLARLAGITEEDDAGSVSFLNPFLQARAAGIAVVFLRHGRKSGGAINVAGRGSGAITGEMDICIQITAPKGVKSDYRYLECVSRLTDTIEEHLRYEDGTYVIGEDPALVRREEKERPLINILMEAPASGLSATEAHELRPDKPKAVTTTMRQLDQLVDAGKALFDEETKKYRPAPSRAGGLQ